MMKKRDTAKYLLIVPEQDMAVCVDHQCNITAADLNASVVFILNNHLFASAQALTASVYLSH